MREFYSPLFITDTTDIKNCKNYRSEKYNK